MIPLGTASPRAFGGRVVERWAARRSAALRRRQPPSDTVFEHGPIRLDADRYRCYVDAGEVALTAKEFELEVRSTFSAGLPAPPS
jgi:hypothetical protein